MPQQELLTQNELLKQQVGQETELLEAGRELHVLARSLVWPGAAPAALVGVSAVVVGSRGLSSASSRPFSWKDHSHGPSCQPTCLGLDIAAGVRDGNTVMASAWGRRLPSARFTHIPPSCQVKIFEEDFQRERSDRERMNEEKEELKQQLEKLQKQLVISNNQVSSAGCHQQHWEHCVHPGYVGGAHPQCHSPRTHLRVGAEGGQKGQRGGFAAACPCQSISFHLSPLSAPLLGI